MIRADRFKEDGWGDVKNAVWDTYMPPFRILENLYFVGTKPASAHLIDTGDGLILLDSGYQQTLYLILDSIRELGFSPYDIRYLLLTHGHIDHLGAARAIQEMTGCKTILGRGDEDYATGKRDLTFAAELGMERPAVFVPDILLDDGDTVRLGNTCIHCIHTPGHTEGTMSFFFDIEHNGTPVRAGMHGGAGMNSMQKAFLESHGLPLSLRDDFRKGLQRLRGEHVDLFIGNHQNQCDTIGKYRRIAAGEEEAFIDAAAWPAFLDACETQLDAMLRMEQDREEGRV